jgi:phosphoribosylanthranilate isomerase
MHTAVKICGITRATDADAAVAAGADALGFVFYPKSARNIAAASVAGIVKRLPPFITTVGLFVDPEAALVEHVLSIVRLDRLQFHGDESPELCRRFGVPYLKAVRVRPETDLLQSAVVHAGASALLLDAFVDGVPGGTGATFDWRLIPHSLPRPIVLSGGLTPGNVADAVHRVRPYGVDVSSGVEVSKGIKDAAKIVAFIKGVRDASV